MKSTKNGAALLFTLTAAATFAPQSSLAAELPDACKPSMPMHHETAPAMPMTGSDAGHQALMDTMTPMHDGMAEGMMADDIDAAFVCGMIPHHQGAIDMAKALLAHGDDPWVRELAQKIIEAQTGEIAEMKDWLEKDGK